MPRPAPPSQASEVRTKPVRKAAPPVGRSLGPHIARLAAASGAMDPRLASEWPKIAGPELAPLCRPIRIITRGRSQALEVAVKSGAAAMKIQYAQEALLGRIRHQLGLPRLQRIVFREGKEARSWQTRRLSAAPAVKETDRAVSSDLKAALDAMRQSVRAKEE
ncbi:MAG: DUF721 domain-containing protein [Pseudomonadota bacterium]